MELHPSLCGKKLENLRKAQMIMTEMFKQFDSICRKHNIKYCTIGGALIGAIRKDKILDNGEKVGGWVPFDGDIDVSMMRDEYIKFRSVSHELPSTMFLQDKKRDKRYSINDCCKIRHLYSHYLNYTPEDSHHGLQIDIFLWDYQGEFVYYKRLEKNRYEEIYHYEVIFPLREIEFEGFNIYVPNKYEEYCKINFGTWPMPLLPINKRFPHEGDVDPDNAHPFDKIWYPHLYQNL
jgi:lipopolysaccharide cholinephosphotransferase